MTEKFITPNKYFSTNILNIFNCLAMFCVFFQSYDVVFGINLYVYYFVMIPLFFLFMFVSQAFNKKIIVFLFCILASGFLGLLMKLNNIQLLFKIWSALTLITLFFGYILYINKNNVQKIFNVYLNFSILFAYVGIFQVISGLIGFKTGYDYSWIPGLRDLSVTSKIYPVHSLTLEPSHYGMVMAPAVYISMQSLLTTKRFFISKINAIIILTTVVLSQSTIAYLGLLISAILLILQNISFVKLMIFPIIIFICLTVLYKINPKFSERVDDSLIIFTDFESVLDKPNAINGSVMTLVNHFLIAKKSFETNPISGGGLGSHEISHAKYSIFKHAWFDSLNTKDANSLFNRIISELGILGLIFMTIFLFKNYVSPNTNLMDDLNIKLLTSISTSILVLIILKLVRDGNYFSYGFPLFMLMYYHTKKSIDKIFLSEYYSK